MYMEKETLSYLGTRARNERETIYCTNHNLQTSTSVFVISVLTTTKIISYLSTGYGVKMASFLMRRGEGEVPEVS